MKTIYLRNENLEWVKISYENIKDLSRELELRNIIISGDSLVDNSYIGNGSRVVNGSRVNGSTVNGSTVDGSTVVDGSRVNGSRVNGSRVVDGSTVDGSIDKYTAIFATNLYEYSCGGYLKKTGKQAIQMECYDRLRSEWEADFWNNPSEFPNDGSPKSEARLRAFKTICFFLDQIKK